MADIILANNSPVATITLNRPDDLNRLTPDSMALLGGMVDDIGAMRKDYAAKGMEPSAMESTRIHEWFTVRGPDGYEITIISSHASDQPV